MAGLAREIGHGLDRLLDTGSTPAEQGKFLLKKSAKSGDFSVLDLTLALIVNGDDCRPRPISKAAVMGP
jgi:hypothetical protein